MSQNKNIAHLEPCCINTYIASTDNLHNIIIFIYKKEKEKKEAISLHFFVCWYFFCVLTNDRLWGG